MHLWNQAVKASLQPLANGQNAKAMSAYLRGQFAFLGIKSTPRREALKLLFTDQLPQLNDINKIVEQLWSFSEREYQLVGLDLLIKQKKKLPVTFLPVLERLIVSKSWWDTVDVLSPHIAAELFLNHPQKTSEYIACWRQSDNIWLRRTTIIFQLKFKQTTDSTLLFEIIKENQLNNEFFIQKAIGWSLREYSKTNPIAVKEFIQRQNIQGLAKREALKYLNR